MFASLNSCSFLMDMLCSVKLLQKPVRSLEKRSPHSKEIDPLVCTYPQKMWITQKAGAFMDHLQPVRPRASHGQPPHQEKENSLGTAIGFLVAGIWLLIFHIWFSFPDNLVIALTGLGVILIAFGLLLIGANIGALFSRRRHG